MLILTIWVKIHKFLINEYLKTNNNNLLLFNLMVNLKNQKRVAAAVLKCGRGRVWIDPNEADQVSQANSSSSKII